MMFRHAVTLLLAAFTLSLAAADNPRTYMGYAVVDMPFRLAGGETVTLPVTEAGPVPAENKSFSVEVAGITVASSKVASTRAALVKQFAVSVKSNTGLRRVVIEQVYPNDVAITLVEDPAPTLNGKLWSGAIAQDDPTVNSDPWLFTEEPSIFVFRFTITPTKGTPSILYQPAWFSRTAKELLRKTISYLGQSRSDLFDGRGWIIGYDDGNEQQHITEFVIPPETVNSWTELITHQRWFIESGSVTPNAFAETVRQQFTCEDLKWTVLAESDAEIIYEWSHGRCGGKSPPQYEISRISVCAAGLCRWAYATKRVPVTTGRAADWLLILRKLDP